MSSVESSCKRVDRWRPPFTGEVSSQSHSPVGWGLEWAVIIHRANGLTGADPAEIQSAVEVVIAADPRAVGRRHVLRRYKIAFPCIAGIVDAANMGRGFGRDRVSTKLHFERLRDILQRRRVVVIGPSIKCSNRETAGHRSD